MPALWPLTVRPACSSQQVDQGLRGEQRRDHREQRDQDAGSGCRKVRSSITITTPIADTQQRRVDPLEGLGEESAEVPPGPGDVRDGEPVQLALAHHVTDRVRAAGAIALPALLVHRDRDEDLGRARIGRPVVHRPPGLGAADAVRPSAA
ncbi:hypothetical protein SALBM311S_12820 [Streptomyces alboniger]